MNRKQPATQLKESPVIPNKPLIEQLTSLLEEAKKGELLGMAYVCSYKGDCVNNGWALGPLGPRRLIGELEYLKWDLIEKSL